MKLQEVRESALSLPVRSRRKLAVELMESVEAGNHKDIENDWMALAEARGHAYATGQLETFSLEEFIQHVRKSDARAAKSFCIGAGGV